MTDFTIKLKIKKDNTASVHLTRKDLAILKTFGLSRKHIMGFVIQGYPMHLIERHVNEGLALPNPATL